MGNTTNTVTPKRSLEQRRRVPTTKELTAIRLQGLLATINARHRLVVVPLSGRCARRRYLVRRVQSLCSRSRHCASKHADGYRDTVYRRMR